MSGTHTAEESSSYIIGTRTEPTPPRSLKGTRYLNSWRTAMKPLVTTSSMTEAAIQAIGTATIARWDDPPDDVDPEIIVAEKRHFIALGTREQSGQLLPRIEKRSASQRELFLLNETYSIDGDTWRLGELTPIEIERWVYAELKGQIADIRKKWADIRNLVKRCKSRTRPIKDQL